MLLGIQEKENTSSNYEKRLMQLTINQLRKLIKESLKSAQYDTIYVYNAI